MLFNWRLGLLLHVLMLCGGSLFAQFTEILRTARPGQSIGTFAAGKKVFQVQTGIDYFSYSGNGIEGYGNLSNTVLRYGITEPFELGVLFEYKGERINGNPVNGISALDLAMRYHICTARKGLLPNIGLVMRYRVPHLGGSYETEKWAPKFILAVSKNITEKIFVLTNWGASWNGIDDNPQGVYTVNISYSITDRLGFFVENYGNVSEGNWNIYFDGGFAYLLNEDLLLDLYTGHGNNDGLSEFYVSAGVSWRIKPKK